MKKRFKTFIGLILIASSLILPIWGQQIPNQIEMALPLLTQGIALLETDLKDEEE